MGRWNGSGQARAAADRATRRHAMAVSIASVVAGAAPLFLATEARAEKWDTDLGASSQLEWTSNANLGEADSRPDVIFGVRPHIRLNGEGPQFKISGFAALNALAYLHGTQPDELQPEADLSASVQAVPRLLFIDAGLRAFQTRENPFGAQSVASATNVNNVTTASARLSPRIEGTAGEHLHYLIRSDNNWTNEGGTTTPAVGTNSSGYYGQHVASIEHDPLPLGWRLEVQRSVTTYRDSTTDPLVIGLARATTLYALSPDLTFGVHGGYERTSFDTPGQGPWIYGVDGKWTPSPRTQLTAFAEERFFGASWRLAFDHHTPLVAWNIVSSRTLQTAPQSVFDLPATNNVAALLDGIFASRYPDPVERARAVQNFIASQGLPTATQQATSLQEQQLSVVNLNMATVTVLGSRNTLTLSGYQTRTADAATVNTGLPTGSSFTNNDQYGASLAATHKLTPAYILTALADWSRITSLPGFGDERTVQKSARLWLNVSVSPRTTTFVGLRYTQLDSNTAVSGRETALFAGLDHHF
jgi:uncharacterized protein (PEP-CTERM system associated)